MELDIIELKKKIAELTNIKESAKSVREAQKDYFLNKGFGRLDHARKEERKLDKLIEDYDDPVKTLF